MKRLILLELVLLFLATTFPSHSPPGWYTQTLLVNDEITDMFFIDSLKGWITTQGGFSGDTAYIMHTTNGGDNWSVQFNSTSTATIKVKFFDENTGYIGSSSGSFARILKTTNGGTNWNLVPGTILSFLSVENMAWVNKDTGWVCNSEGLFGGLVKTTNGGLNWVRQMSADSLISHVFFINKDTGWVSSADRKLLRTTNGGVSWVYQYRDPTVIDAIFFLNGNKGWLRGGTGNGVRYTTDGGFSWINATGENAGFSVHFINDTIGWSGGGNFSNRIAKSTDGGKNWGYQVTPSGISPNIIISVLKNNLGFARAGRNKLIATNDSGGNIIFTGVNQISTEVPVSFKLYQNYPNPFNPSTKINYELRTANYVKLAVYDINGREVQRLHEGKQIAGKYEAVFDGAGLPSGAYFYRLETESFTDTKKMLLVK